jgi:hypothetical protein
MVSRERACAPDTTSEYCKHPPSLNPDRHDDDAAVQVPQRELRSSRGPCKGTVQEAAHGWPLKTRKGKRTEHRVHRRSRIRTRLHETRPGNPQPAITSHSVELRRRLCRSVLPQLPMIHDTDSHRPRRRILEETRKVHPDTWSSAWQVPLLIHAQPPSGIHSHPPTPKMEG